MFDLATLARLNELGGSSHPDLPAGEDLAEAQRQSRREHERESQRLDEGMRQWWLSERGWLTVPVVGGRSTGPGGWNRILRPVGTFLVAWFLEWRSRSKPVTSPRAAEHDPDLTTTPGIVGPTT
jgi:hypothetical protein